MSILSQKLTVPGWVRIALYVGSLLFAFAVLWLCVIRYEKTVVSGFTGVDARRNSGGVTAPRAELLLLEGANWEVRSGGVPIGVAVMSQDAAGPYTFTVQSTTRGELYKGLVFSIARSSDPLGPMVCPECLNSIALNRVLPFFWRLADDEGRPSL